MANFIHRWVQPLKVREHFGFEYTGPEDLSRMVPMFLFRNGDGILMTWPIFPWSSILRELELELMTPGGCGEC